ncbi:MAG: nitronate monooxygenase [Pseudomonadota bacterium]
MQTQFTHKFRINRPIAQGGMGGVAGPKLVAAVANAGGLGILPIWPQSPDAARASIEQTQSLTDRPFAVNLRADLQQIVLIETALAAGIKLFNLFWGDPAASMPTIAAGEGRLIATVGDLAAARHAVNVGAAALIAQGVEAGGHVLGETPCGALLDQLIKAALGVPIIAAGGLATAADVARVMAKGADAALLGTRFVVAEESTAHPAYKQAIIAAASGSTVRTTCFDGMWPDAPHRVIRNSTYEAWHAAGCPPEGERPGEGDPILTLRNNTHLPRYFVATPSDGMSGTIEASAMYAGTGLGAITAIEPAADIVADLVSLLED